MSSQSFVDALPSGTKLLWFEVVKVLGKGGFGITYLGHDTNHNQHVAIKEYLPATFSSRSEHLEIQPNSPADEPMFEWGLDRFIKEAQILAQFNHPSIVRVVSFFRSNNTAYMVMEYVEGDGLDIILRRHKTLDESKLKQFSIMLFDGLEILHKADFIHRDIKPANLLIRKTTGLPVILDFGAARQSIAGQGSQMTSFLSMGYSPFEQYDSTGVRQGPWSDIYALGGVLYRAVTGKRPLEATSRITARLRNDPDPLLTAELLGKGRYSATFLQAIDKALMVLENERPQSIDEWRSLMFAGSSPSAMDHRFSGEKIDTAANVTDAPKNRPKSSWRGFIASMETFAAHVEQTPQHRLDANIHGVVTPTAGEVQPILSDEERSDSWENSAGISTAKRYGLPRVANGIAGFEQTLPPLDQDDGSRIFSGETASIRDVGTIWTEPVTNMEFIWVPGGVFTMGAENDDVSRQDDEKPQHAVQLDGYWISKYPVTWGKWRRIMKDYPPGLFMRSKTNYPVERISWYDTQTFIETFTRMIGSRYTFRLPSEAEWECAARAGVRALPQPAEITMQSKADLIEEYAWYKGNSHGQTQPVGKKKANAWGIHDMLGNVWEWLDDRYQEDYYQKSPKTNPRGLVKDSQGGRITGVGRVVRGGGWGSTAHECWPTNRHRFAEKTATVMLGFRLLRED